MAYGPGQRPSARSLPPRPAGSGLGDCETSPSPLPPSWPRPPPAGPPPVRPYSLSCSLLPPASPAVCSASCRASRPRRPRGCSSGCCCSARGRPVALALSPPHCPSVPRRSRCLSGERQVGGLQGEAREGSLAPGKSTSTGRGPRAQVASRSGRVGGESRGGEVHRAKGPRAWRAEPGAGITARATGQRPPAKPVPAGCSFGGKVYALDETWHPDLGEPFGVMRCVLCACEAVSGYRSCPPYPRG